MARTSRAAAGRGRLAAVAPPKAITKDELYRALEGWSLEQPAANGALSDRLWQELGRHRAVLVSDMSGFTRITRERGLLQFLAVFGRAQQLGRLVFERHGGRYLKHEADNLIALFDTAAAAAAAARDLLWEARAHNARVPDASGHVRFCVGVSCGRVIELEDDAFGDPVNVAFKLGEDVARSGEILVSDAVREELATSPAHRDLHDLLQGPHDEVLGGVAMRHWLLPPRTA